MLGVHKLEDEETVINSHLNLTLDLKETSFPSLFSSKKTITPQTLLTIVPVTDKNSRHRKCPVRVDGSMEICA
jgi:hypothetical protein